MRIHHFLLVRWSIYFYILTLFNININLKINTKNIIKLQIVFIVILFSTNQIFYWWQFRSGFQGNYLPCCGLFLGIDSRNYHNYFSNCSRIWNKPSQFTLLHRHYLTTKYISTTQCYIKAFSTPHLPSLNRI